MVKKNYDDMLSCFHLIPNVTDRQTDGQTDGQNCYINIALTRTSAIYLFKLMSFIINIIKFIINILCDSVLLMDLLQSSTRVFVRSVTPEHIVSYVIMKTKKNTMVIVDLRTVQQLHFCSVIRSHLLIRL